MSALDEIEQEQQQQVPRGGESIKTFLQRTRERLAAEEADERLLLVRTWKGALAIRYRFPEDGGSDRIIKAVSRAQERNLPEDLRNANMDVLIACCHEVLCREVDENWQPVSEWESIDRDGGSRVRFTSRLADLIGLEVPDRIKSPARFICRNVFSPQQVHTGIYHGDIAMMNQAGDVLLWLCGAETRADEGVEGK